jgi:hypothetical protein
MPILPVYMETVQVRIVGNRNATKVRLFRYALSVAYAIVAIRGRPSTAEVTVTYNMTTKEVVLKVSNTTGIGSAFISTGDLATGIAKLTHSVPESVFGSDWAGLLKAASAAILPAGMFGPAGPPLPLGRLPDTNTWMLHGPFPGDPLGTPSTTDFQDIHLPSNNDTAGTGPFGPGGLVQSLVTQVLTGAGCATIPKPQAIVDTDHPILPEGF